MFVKTPISTMNDADIQAYEQVGKIIDDPEWGILRTENANWYFNHAKATAALLMNDVIKLISPSGLYGLGVAIPHGDLFVPGSVSITSIAIEDLPLLYNLWVKDPIWGPSVFLIFSTTESVNPYIAKQLESAGYDLSSLRSESRQELLDKLRINLRVNS